MSFLPLYQSVRATYGLSVEERVADKITLMSLYINRYNTKSRSSEEEICIKIAPIKFY